MTHRETLIAYLTMKVAAEDWHAVADASMDLRELDAEERGRTIDRLERISADMVAVEGGMGVSSKSVTFEALRNRAQEQAACVHQIRYKAVTDDYRCTLCGMVADKKFAAPV